MAYLYILTIGLMLFVPQIGHDAYSPKVQETLLGENALITGSTIASNHSTLPPVLSKIASCESGGNHYDKNGKVLKGLVNSKDIGKYQINSEYWKKEAEALGFDLYTEEGNEAMALAIYEKHGTWPWEPSRNCWDK
ncbi:hypothetical protein HYW53_02920 [Candidatus Giovannonibacteria bacterium]|nr:hypothetical protein [Candidatus Giovannonibacteria bacterium]